VKGDEEKFKIQGLEEVTEMTEESDMTSQSSSPYLYEDAYSENSSSYSDSSDSETMARVRMSEEIKEIDKASREMFREALIPFKFDFEDYETCWLNGEIRKIIEAQKLTLPIVHLRGTN